MFKVVRTAPFTALLTEISADHRNIESDIVWLEGRLAQAPEQIGDCVPGLASQHPVFKTRCKDSCCRLSASEAWRVYYTVNKSEKQVALFFVIHKKEAENCGKTYLNQKIDRAFPA